MGTDNRDNRTPFQIEQENEARGRNSQIVDDAGNQVGADPQQEYIDDATGEPADRARPVPQDRQREAEPEPVVVDRRPPGDIKRAQIAARFKHTDPGEDDVPFNGDATDPEMQYGSVARKTLTPEPGDSAVGSQIEPEPDPEPQPKLTKLVIRGKDVWLTDAQILERASKVEAGDSYLDEGRRLMEEARVILNKAKRGGQDPQHPEDQTHTQDDGLNPDPELDGQHPDQLEQAIEEIQFGDPKQAASKIRQVIEQAADESSNKRQRTRLLDNDLAKSQDDLRAFYADHPELVKDDNANVVLLKNVYDIYRADIAKLGIDPSQIPKDDIELANWYRFYRVDGKPVKSARAVFDQALTEYNRWRGVSPNQTQQQQQRAAPRIDVNVDRTERRRNIPNQPNRAVAPRPDVQQQAPQRKSRHQIIMDMKRSRGRPVPSDA